MNKSIHDTWKELENMSQSSKNYETNKSFERSNPKYHVHEITQAQEVEDKMNLFTNHIDKLPILEKLVLELKNDFNQGMNQLTNSQASKQNQIQPIKSCDTPHFQDPTKVYWI